jgi:hypothetical protein
LQARRYKLNSGAQGEYAGLTLEPYSPIEAMIKENMFDSRFRSRNKSSFGCDGRNEKLMLLKNDGKTVI